MFNDVKSELVLILSGVQSIYTLTLHFWSLEISILIFSVFLASQFFDWLDVWSW